MARNKRIKAKRKLKSKLGPIDKKQRKHLLDFGEQHPIDDEDNDQTNDIKDHLSNKFVKTIDFNEIKKRDETKTKESIETIEDSGSDSEDNAYTQLLKFFGKNTDKYDSSSESESEELMVRNNEQKSQNDSSLNNNNPKISEESFNMETIELMEGLEEEHKEEDTLIGDIDKERHNDPFSLHFDRELNVSDIEYLSKDPKKSIKEHELSQIKKLIEINNENQKFSSDSIVLKKNIENYFLKNIIIENLSKAVLTSNDSQKTDLNGLQMELLSIISDYKDLFFTERNLNNGEDIRLIYTIHALNHVLKTRSRILHHNYKIKTHVSTNEEYRDQGLSRTKVLILVPFRDSVLKIVKILISLMFGDIKDKSEKRVNVMNAKRFFEEFSPEEEMPKLHKKPEDYELTFAGNIDDSFRIGISVTKKSLKLYSDFYSSDIIIGSPLGLRMIIGSEGDKQREYDFLSSIEMVIMDQTEVFLMQNWEHVLHIIKHLHLKPTQSRDIDFSRVRMWTLEGWQKYYCQFILFSSVTVPTINAFFNQFSHNYCGKYITKNEINSSNASVNSVYIQCPQIFQRFDCSSLVESPNQRFDFFVSTILPKFRDKLMGRTMIYIPSYFDFVRIRNYFRKQEINFTQICEYTKDGKVAKARSMFFNGGRHFMLYTERFHYYHRYKIKGIRHLIFYELPTFAHFYSELINLMHISMQGKKFFGDYSSMSTTVVYNKFDALQLAAVVGLQKARQMLRSSTTVHMFVTESQ